jgi:hypothetical protein
MYTARGRRSEQEQEALQSEQAARIPEADGCGEGSIGLDIRHIRDIK